MGTTPLTMSDLGKRGGAATRERHGAAHYAAAGRKGGATTKARYGTEYYRALRQTPAQRAAAAAWPHLCATAHALVVALTGTRHWTLRQMADALPPLRETR